MCAIAGIIQWKNRFSRQQLAVIGSQMRDAMVYRGPDDVGLWINPAGTCVLAHRRLAIIDLSPAGRQPMANHDASVWVTFNGEIYNFRELRHQLLAAGYPLKSKTDSEVLPYLFADSNTANITKLDGMFAFAVWNERSKRLLLARDPFGKKPLYYSVADGYFAFASELKALSTLPSFDKTIDKDALSLYLLTQYVPAPFAIFKGAKKLLPGHCLEADFSNGDSPKIRTVKYADFKPAGPESEDKPLQVLEDQLSALVVESVAKRLVSDVPLGAFLSGGVDSSLVAAIATKELGRQLKTFTIGFAGADDSEHLAAREIAEYLGTDHHEKLLKPDAISLVDEIATRLDEPNGDSSCLPTLLLSQYAREQVTVALSGDGGDEMFGGYGRYRDTLNEAQAWAEKLAQGAASLPEWRASSAYLSPRWLIFQPETVHLLLGEIPQAMQQTLEQWRQLLDDSGMALIHRMRYLDAQTYLPGAVLAKVDRMSMQASLEVRCPLLDMKVAQFAQNLSAEACWKPPGETKRLLKQLASRYLPEDWMKRPKLGFGLPANAWSKDLAMALAKDTVLGADGQLRQHVDKAALEQLLVNQESRYFSIYRVWPLLILESWLRKNS